LTFRQKNNILEKHSSTTDIFIGKKAQIPATKREKTPINFRILRRASINDKERPNHFMHSAEKPYKHSKSNMRNSGLKIDFRRARLNTANICANRTFSNTFQRKKSVENVKINNVNLEQGFLTVRSENRFNRRIPKKITILSKHNKKIKHSETPLLKGKKLIYEK